MLVKCRFLDDNNQPKGREYTYGSREKVALGEFVTTEEGKKLIVTSTSVPNEEGEKIGDKLKYINAIIDLDAESVTVKEPKKQEFIIVKQLPIIEESLKALSDEIDTKVNEALALDCTEDSVKTVKTARADLNKILNSMEEKRMVVKNAIMAPYEQFNGIYKAYVSDKIKDADNTLKKRIDEVENNLRKTREAEVKSYFAEYLLSKNIDFITYQDAGINVTLSASLKSLKEKAKEFIDRISDDLALIDTQEFKEEILFEYRRNLNCSQAITTVVARHKAIEERKVRQAEIEARKQSQAEAAKKVGAVSSAPLEPPKQAAEPAQIPKTEATPDPVKTLSFKVTAPISKLKELKAFLTEGGYKYE
ncbi:DUF1351 domain-containing protein [Anaerotignum sp. MB30-C6]|uniref:DUF1351 domain-containing protein n=1 Tax=Anaerotignum sp. MB30-C6 TaxID=3070814 RepID=UPI0027DBE808|nr:DUF1351 domain-containing protein [Anaerotignum sp. MB30-C6]WMI81907.1 DUF1351 domain-containing protein [Anaerotignum sp. MB30-C6]